MHDKPEPLPISGLTSQTTIPVGRSVSAQSGPPSHAHFFRAPEIAPDSTGILCGTDFSGAATRAVEVAGALARRLGEPLTLVHAVSDRSREHLPAELRESLGLYARAQLHDEQERLHALGVKMFEVLGVGAPDSVLLEEAREHHARLLVLTAEKTGFPSRWLHSGVTERVAETATVPTLVVREPIPLLRWTSGERRLRVFVAADFSAPAEAALHWVDWLRNIGPCEIVVAGLEAIPSVYGTNDFFPSLLMDEMVLKAAHVQERFFRHRIRALLGSSHVRVRYEKGWGRSDAHLIHLAVQERADLIVIGTHSRQGWHRLGHHSVSRGVLRYAQVNVVCVPHHPNDLPQQSSSDCQSTPQPSNL